MTDKITNIKTLILNKIDYCFHIVLNNDEDVLDVIASKLENGYKMVLVEIGNISTADFIKTSRKIHQLCSIYNALFIVKNRADICYILKADGLCLDDNEIEIKQAKDIIGEDKLISRHFKNIQNSILSDLNEIDYIIQEKNEIDALNDILGASNKKIITIKR